MPAIRPRVNVIAFHGRNLKLVSAGRTDSGLLLIGFLLLCIRKLANAQPLYIPCENVRIDTGLFGHVIIQDQAGNLGFDFLRI